VGDSAEEDSTASAAASSSRNMAPAGAGHEVASAGRVHIGGRSGGGMGCAASGPVEWGSCSGFGILHQRRRLLGRAARERVPLQPRTGKRIRV
jgi:hypothetical protein